MYTIAYSAASYPSATRLRDEFINRGHDAQLIRDSTTPVDINWGRYRANTSLNADISNTTNKRVMRELLRDQGVPMPKLLRLEDRWEWPVVGRPDRHTKGRGFWLIHNPGELRRAVEGTRKKKAATHFMEYIDAPHEYRVHIFKGRSIRISEKDFLSPGDNRSYSTIRPTGPVGHVREAAKQAVEAVGLNFGAVDVLANDTEAWVLEVNAAPGIGGSVPRVYVDAILREGE